MPDTTTRCATEQKRHPRSPKITVPLIDRAAWTPNEFAALHGREATWTYRLLYANKLKAIKSLGRTLIPRSEMQRIMQTAEAIG